MTNKKAGVIFNPEEVIILNKRFVEIRKHLKLTQDEFGKRLGTSRDAIANIEYGRVEPSQMIIKLTCKEFGVDEIWLRTGVGEMFREVSREEQVASFFMGALSGDDNFKKAFVSALSALDETAWEKLRDFADQLYEEYKD